MLDVARAGAADVVSLKLVKHGGLLATRDVAAVADALIELLGDPAGAAAMGSRGLAWVNQEWRWDFVAERLAQILAG